MTRSPAPLPATLGTVFTVREAIAAGVSRNRLRAADIEHPFSGVCRVRSQPARAVPNANAAVLREREHRDDARALARVLPPGHFFAGCTAALLLRIPLPRLPRQAIQVACIRPERPIRYRGVRARTLPPGIASIRQADGLPVCDPATAWALAAPLLSFEDRVALGDAVIRHPRYGGTERYERDPHATHGELAALLTVPGLRLPRDLGKALAALSHQSASPPESHLRLLLEAWGFPRPQLDFDVRDNDGRFLGTSEIAYPELKIALEYEGLHHLHETKQWNRDIEKYSHYQAAGWAVVRVTASLLYVQHRELHECIARALRSRGWRG